MAIVQSKWASGLRQAPVAAYAGVVVCEHYEFTLTADMASTDILELGVLPAYNSVVDAVLITDNLGAGVTVDVGIMSGVKGDPDPARTSGNQLFAAAANNAVVRMSKAEGFRIAPVDADRSIGLKVSGAVTASGQKITLVLSTKQ